MNTDVLCIGAGPAGLTAAYLLSKENKKVLVLEKDQKYVGGISRTVEHKGFRFDIGGHRFFSKSKEVMDMWDEILGDDFLNRPRKSRIYYQGKFFNYPIKPVEALLKLSFFDSCLSLLSYAKYKLFPIKKVESFQDWVCNKFGAHLFNIFFKTYTEKVWGMPCSEISADWAAQRIKGLSLSSVIKNALIPKWLRKNEIKTLIPSFKYPRLGPGMMWDAATDKIKLAGNKVELDCEVSALHYDNQKKLWEVSYKSAEKTNKVLAQDVISSMPMRELIAVMTPRAPQAVIDAANSLKYRDFLLVALMTKTEGDFDDNWIYIHDPLVKVGRVQNFRSWSPELLPKAGLNCYGMEYFCFEGDGLWNTADKDLIKLAIEEVKAIGLVTAENITGGYVVRQPKAYPVYDDEYQTHVDVIAQYLQKNYPSLHLVGRNGMHKYNNQDHAMMTAMLTTKNIVAKQALYDVWQVNQDAEYHESARLVPSRRSKS